MILPKFSSAIQEVLPITGALPPPMAPMEVFMAEELLLILGFLFHPVPMMNTFNGDFDIAIIKLTPDGKQQVYATYIGGSSSDQPHSLIVDPQGNLIIAGRSKSTGSSDQSLNYPTTVPVYGTGWWLGYCCYQIKCNGQRTDWVYANRRTSRMMV